MCECVLKNESEGKRKVREREIYFKDLAHQIVKSGKSKPCRQAGALGGTGTGRGSSSLKGRS